MGHSGIFPHRKLATRITIRIQRFEFRDRRLSAQDRFAERLELATCRLSSAIAATLIELGWLWLRHQPQSALAPWFQERVNRQVGRLKKTTIVALARKLLVAYRNMSPPASSSGSRGESHLTPNAERIFRSSRT